MKAADMPAQRNTTFEGDELSMAGLAIRAELRSTGGKGRARQVRATGKVPAVIYGTTIAPQPIAVDARQLQQLVEHGAEGRLVTVQLADDQRAAILREVQRDVLKGTVLHADFHAVALDQAIQTPVSIVVLGEHTQDMARVIVHGAREVMVECLPTAIPEYFEVNVESLQVGETIRAEDLELPAGVALVSDLDTVIVSATAPRAALEEAAPEEGVEGAEPKPVGTAEAAEE
jgi:large subunit ribosomal protein L25